jgi:hypothetical protein
MSLFCNGVFYPAYKCPVIVPAPTEAACLRRSDRAQELYLHEQEEDEMGDEVDNLVANPE